MNQKRWRIIGIVLGVLVLIIILIGPAAPLWVRLGVKPFCLQGEWPNVKIVSCTTQRSAATPMPLPSLSATGPIPIIVDDDGSPDGTIALLFFLGNPRFDVRAITISPGEAHPGIFAPRIQQLLAALGWANIPVGAGRETPLDGNNAFPDEWRQASDNFWWITLPQSTVDSEPAPAAQLIVDTVNNSDQPMLIFVSGTHTNLAQALRLDPKIAQNIRDVFVMGGSINVAGNIHSDWPSIDNEVAEWNIWVDPIAADEVFSSGLPLHLVPLDATQQVLWTQSDADTWKSFGSARPVLASEILQMMLNNWSANGVYIWDLVTAAQAANPALCPEKPLAIDIVTMTGPDQGQTKVIEGNPNVGVCLNPDAWQVKALVEATLGGK